jgi:lactoylglutathione lyase
MQPFVDLIVLLARDVEMLTGFYCALGRNFQKERHGEGLEHYSCVRNQIVFEIYPRCSDEPSTTGVRLGFRVPSVEPSMTQWGRRSVIKDPEGHIVELSEDNATSEA